MDIFDKMCFTISSAGSDGITNHVAENNMAKFKGADVIGHPAGYVFSLFASSSGYTCKGATTAYFPYFHSPLDPIAWHYGIPESVSQKPYPAATRGREHPVRRSVEERLTCENALLMPEVNSHPDRDDFKSAKHRHL